MEFHTSARFVQLLNASENSTKPGLSTANSILLTAHNLIYWFFIIPFVTPMSYSTGFLVYAIILLTRFAANTIINIRNFNTEEYFAYPFRIP